MNPGLGPVYESRLTGSSARIQNSIQCIVMNTGLGEGRPGACALTRL